MAILRVEILGESRGRADALKERFFSFLSASWALGK